jgi:D-tyrosyl-tRNA(Tyr) deacylase
MRALIQRVARARVDVEGAGVGAIGPGLAAFVGVTHADTPATADRLADKVWNLRVFADTEGAMNRSLADVAAGGQQAEVLVVPQFTLYGDTCKGRRPSWVDAARPEHAEPLVDRVAVRLGELGATVATGRFRTHMLVTLTNDGPVTLMLEV